MIGQRQQNMKITYVIAQSIKVVVSMKPNHLKQFVHHISDHVIQTHRTLRHDMDQEYWLERK